MTELDLRQEIDRSFGDGPDHRPVEQRIAAGRRAVVLRRAGSALAAAVVVAALGGTAWVAAPDDRLPRGSEIADDPASGEVATEPWAKGDPPARYTDGELELRPGVVVHQHVDNPLGLEPPARSDAFDLTFRGRRQWLIIEDRSDGSSSSSSAMAGAGPSSFEEFVAEGVAGRSAPHPELLVLDESGHVVAAPGAVVLQRTDDPRLGPTWSRPASSTGAALVQAGEEGRTYFYAWRVLAGQSLQLYVVPPDEVVGATFEELLSSARARLAPEVEQ